MRRPCSTGPASGSACSRPARSQPPTPATPRAGPVAGPTYTQGHLGVDWAYDPATEGYTVGRIVEGDSWDPGVTSPLNRPGVDVQAGDAVLAVNGQPVGGAVTPAEWLVNQADQEVL